MSKCYLCVKMSLKVYGDITDVSLMREKMPTEEDAWFDKHSIALLIVITSDSHRTTLRGGCGPSTSARSVDSDSPGLQKEEEGQQGYETPWETLTSLPHFESVDAFSLLRFRPSHCRPSCR